VRFVLRDYIQSLRERSELDRVVTDLVSAMGGRLLATPQRGQREFGVDVAALITAPRKGMKLQLLQVKQGNITRKNWSGGQNSVRASVEEAVDHLDQFIQLAGSANVRETEIVIVTNGEVERNVTALAGFTKGLMESRNVRLTVWDVHTLVALLLQHLFREQLFSHAQANLLRRTLAFLEVPEYDLHHLDDLLSLMLTNETRDADRIRTLLQIQMALTMIQHYSLTAEQPNVATSVRAYEKAFLRTYSWLHREKALESSAELNQLMRLVVEYMTASAVLLSKIDPLLDVEHGLALGGWHEALEYPQRSMRFGALAAQWVIFGTRLPTPDEVIQRFGRSLLRLRSSTSLARPLFDHQLTEIVLIAIGLFIVDGDEECQDYIREVVNRLHIRKLRHEPLPEGVGSFEAVAEAMIKKEKPDWYVDQSSTMLTMLAEVAAIFRMDTEYDLIRRNWPEVNLQNCYLDETFVSWAAERRSETPDTAIAVEMSIRLPTDPREIVASFDDRFHDREFMKLTALSFFELFYHTACRVKGLRVSPITWRSLKSVSDDGNTGDVARQDGESSS
jgi:hypothetical protein